MTKECDSPKEQQPRILAIRRNLEKLKLELHNINRGIDSHVQGKRVNGTWGASRYLIGEEDDTESDGGEIEKKKNCVYVNFFSYLGHNKSNI